MPVRLPLRLALVLAAAAACLAPVPAVGQEAAAIGVAAPLSGPAALLGRQVLAGAEAAGAGAPLVSADTRCEAAGGAEAAERLRAAGARVVVGFLCAEALEAALPILSRAGIPVIAAGVRADRITDDRARSGALVWRLGPRSSAEAAAVLAAIAARWPGARLAVVDDGAPESRALADAVRGGLEAADHAPVLATTLRAGSANQSLLAGRIAASGARNLFVAAGPGDAAVLARDAATAGTPFAILGGESLFDEGGAAEVPELPAGTLALAPRGFYPPDDPAAPGASTDPSAAGYREAAAAATEIARQALARAGMGGDVAAALSAGGFDTRLGRVSFDDKGDARLDHFALFEWRDGRFRPAPEARP